MQPIMAWQLAHAMPVKFKFADLNAKGTEVGIEELHFVHEGPFRGLERFSHEPARSPLRQPLPTVVKATLKALPNGDAVCRCISIRLRWSTPWRIPIHSRAAIRSGANLRRQFTGKLTMDLQFDTTDTGVDVRRSPRQVALFMQSSAAANKAAKSDSGANPPAPSVLSFDWGAYQFQGFMESFKETIDFFSADGIPLRALVSIALARQDNVFDAGSANTDGRLRQPAYRRAVRRTRGETYGGQLGGDPNATRALASANGLENPRFTGGAALEVGGGIQLNAAVGFVASASAGGGIGISGGRGSGSFGRRGLGYRRRRRGLSAQARRRAPVFGVSASARRGSIGGLPGASVGVGVSVSTSAGGQVSLAAGGGALFGSTASAGVPATAGAFAGLEAGRATISTTAQLDPLRMLPATVGSDVAAGANASFGLGGVAMAPSGFSTDVGATFQFYRRADFRQRLIAEERLMSVTSTTCRCKRRPSAAPPGEPAAGAGQQQQKPDIKAEMEKLHASASFDCERTSYV